MYFLSRKVKSIGTNSSPDTQQSSDYDDNHLLMKREKDIFGTNRISFNSTFASNEDENPDSRIQQQRQQNVPIMNGHHNSGRLLHSTNTIDSITQLFRVDASESKDQPLMIKFEDDMEVASTDMNQEAAPIMDRPSSDKFPDTRVLTLRNPEMPAFDRERNAYLDKIFYSLDRLRLENVKTMETIDKLHFEQRKNRKRGNVVLFLWIIFAILLTVLSLGGSFSSVYFLKDTEISSNGELVSVKDGQLVSTSSKVVSFTMDAAQVDYNTGLSNRNRHHRSLTDRMMSDFCPETSGNSTGLQCNFIGTMKQPNAVEMYQSFCPNWPKKDRCIGAGLPFVHLSCGETLTKIYGGIYLAPKAPAQWTARQQYTIFPSQNQGYYGEQSFSKGKGKGICVQNFDFAVYCPSDSTACLVFAAYYNTNCNRNKTMVCS